MRVAERELAHGTRSGGETRSWLKAVSVSFGLDSAVVESLTLIASELLANAFLHATGPFAVSLEVEREIVRIGVSDRSSTPPVLKAFDEYAATGRGLRIVQASAVEWGVDLREDGKTVWADVALPDLDEIGETSLQPGDRAGRGDGGRRDRPQPGGGRSRTSSNRPPSVLLERTAARTGLEVSAHPAKVRQVRYQDVPVDEFIAMRARIEAMLRESTLIVLGGERGDVPKQLLELAERATTQFLAVARAEASAPPQPVRLRPESGLGDFVVDFPVGAVDQLEEFGRVVHELNEWCESDQVLVSPLTDGMKRLHRWAIGEAARQIRDRDATPVPYAEA